ncbi:tetratricopeptide repeat protein [Longimicrobium sp.]|uniref:tetratricopeptide repeat protein n=1 Tax=Longimicrobium sp. TaxID=2029185 RepID=UPI002ED87AAC
MATSTPQAGLAGLGIFIVLILVVGIIGRMLGAVDAITKLLDNYEALRRHRESGALRRALPPLVVILCCAIIATGAIAFAMGDKVVGLAAEWAPGFLPKSDSSSAPSVGLPDAGHQLPVSGDTAQPTDAGSGAAPGPLPSSTPEPRTNRPFGTRPPPSGEATETRRSAPVHVMETPPATTLVATDGLSTAQAYYDNGAAKRDQGDYRGARESFNEALALLDNSDPSIAAFRAEVVESIQKTYTACRAEGRTDCL